MMLLSLCFLQLVITTFAANPRTTVSSETSTTELGTGEKVTLNCNVSRSKRKSKKKERIVIDWFKDGVLLRSGGEKYEIASLNYKDQGYYYCKVNGKAKTSLKRKHRGLHLSIKGFVTAYVKFVVKSVDNKTTLENAYNEIVEQLEINLQKQPKRWLKVTENKLIKRKTKNKMKRRAVVRLIVYLEDEKVENLQNRLDNGIQSARFKGFKILKRTVRIKTIDQCLPRTSGKRRLRGQFQLPLTDVGKSVDHQCPYGPPNKIAIFTCLAGISGARWKSPNRKNCDYKSYTTKQLEKLANKKVNRENATQVSRQAWEIAKNARAEDYNEADIGFFQKLIKEIVDVDGINSNVEDVVQIVDSILNANKSIIRESQHENKAAKRFIELIEAIAANLSVPEGRKARQIVTPNLIIKSEMVNAGTLEGYRLSLKRSETNDNFTEKMISNSSDTLEGFETVLRLSSEIFNANGSSKQRKRKVAASIFNNAKLFQPLTTVTEESSIDSEDENEDDTFSTEELEETDEHYNTSRVISCSVVGLKMVKLKEPVELSFRGSGNSHSCVFWDFKANNGQGNWSTEGCWLASATSKNVICHCNHMTNFAVLFSAGGSEVTKKNTSHAVALSIISYIGCAISLIGVLLTLITYAMFRSLRKSHAQHILLNFCVALALLLIIFMAGATRVGEMPGCRAVAVLLHYFVLAVVLWMGVEGYQMYLAFVKVMATYQKNFMIKISVFAWGVPAVIVTVTAAITITSYGNEQHCVLSGIAFTAALFVPSVVMLAGNFIIFFIVLWSLSAAHDAGRVDKCDDIWRRCRTGLAILVLLGLTWSFGAFAIKEASLVFEYLFCIFNSLQGFFIFIFYCVRPPEVRKKWRGVFSTDSMENSVGTSSSATKNRSSGLQSPQIV